MKKEVKTEFKNINTISIDVKNQIERLRKIWQRHLEQDLIGIYLHGSLALGYFEEGASDLDILMVCRERLPRRQRLAIAQEIMELDNKPCSLEMSAIWIQDLQPWKHPTPCQFHYSDYWTETYRKLIDGQMKECFLVDTDFEDADIACHVKLTKQCGICVCGNPIEQVFPDVPEDDFWKSISADVKEYDFHAYNPKYFSSNILILGRILSYKKLGRILSKYEGGLWMLNFVPEKFRYIIEGALNTWYGGLKFPGCGEDELEELKEFLVKEILTE